MPKAASAAAGSCQENHRAGLLSSSIPSCLEETQDEETKGKRAGRGTLSAAAVREGTTCAHSSTGKVLVGSSEETGVLLCGRMEQARGAPSGRSCRSPDERESQCKGYGSSAGWDARCAP